MGVGAEKESVTSKAENVDVGWNSENKRSIPAAHASMTVVMERSSNQGSSISYCGRYGFQMSWRSIFASRVLSVVGDIKWNVADVHFATKKRLDGEGKLGDEGEANSAPVVYRGAYWEENALRCKQRTFGVYFGIIDVGMTRYEFTDTDKTSRCKTGCIFVMWKEEGMGVCLVRNEGIKKMRMIKHGD